MAHQTRDELDKLAASAASQVQEQIAAEDPPAVALAYGAEGEDVRKLVDLLALLGHTTNDVVRGAPPMLNESVLADVRDFMTAASLPFGPARYAPDALQGGVEGELVDDTVLEALYAAAAKKADATAGEASPGA